MPHLTTFPPQRRVADAEIMTVPPQWGAADAEIKVASVLKLVVG